MEKVGLLSAYNLFGVFFLGRGGTGCGEGLQVEVSNTLACRKRFLCSLQEIYGGGGKNPYRWPTVHRGSSRRYFCPTKDLFDAWAKNTIQGGTGSTYWISHVPLTAVAGQCPLGFRELWEAEYFHFHMGFEDALRKEHLGKGIVYWTEKIFPTAMLSKKPVRTLAELKGLKVRSSGKIADVLKAAGASPVLVPGEEIYTALSTGVIDAAHWGAAAGALTMKLCEPAKYYIQPNLAFFCHRSHYGQQKGLG